MILRGPRPVLVLGQTPGELRRSLIGSAAPVTKWGGAYRPFYTPSEHVSLFGETEERVNQMAVEHDVMME